MLIRVHPWLLVAELDLARIAEETSTLDLAGHYSRPDVFDLRVKREPMQQVKSQ